jgi:hypothetical protein
MNKTAREILIASITMQIRAPVKERMGMKWFNPHHTIPTFLPAS